EFSREIISVKYNDHNSKDAGKKHQGERVNANASNVIHDQTQAGGGAKGPGESGKEKQEHSTHPSELLQAEASNPSEWRKHFLLYDSRYLNQAIIENHTGFQAMKLN